MIRVIIEASSVLQAPYLTCLCEVSYCQYPGQQGPIKNGHRTPYSVFILVVQYRLLHRIHVPWIRQKH